MKNFWKAYISRDKNITWFCMEQIVYFFKTFVQQF